MAVMMCIFSKLLFLRLRHNGRRSETETLGFFLLHFSLEFLCSAVADLVTLIDKITDRPRRILGLFAFCYTVGETVAYKVRVTAEEVWDRITFLAGLVDDSMDIRSILVVGPFHEEISQVDDVGTFDRFDLEI